MKNVFINCNIIDVTDNCALKPDCSIFVDGGKIVKISDRNEKTDGWQIVDLKGKYVMPGMINAHAHLFGTGRPSKVISGGAMQKALLKLIEFDFGKKILDSIVASNAKTALLSGVTTVRSSGDMQYSDVRVRDRIKKGELDGARLIVPGPAITVSGGHGDGTFGITADTEEGLRECVKRNFENNVDYIKICITGGVMDAKKEGEPGEVKMSLTQTKAVVDEAHKFGFKVASHTESPEGMKIAIEAGVDTIEHGSDFDEKHAEMLKAYDGAVVPTFSPALPICRLDNALTKLPPIAIKNGEVVVQGMVNAAKSAKRHNVKLGCGTDASCPFVTQYDTWREAVYLTKMTDMTNAEAIYTITLGNAKVIGADKYIGSIEAGKAADLVVFENNPVENIRELSRPQTVVARGKIYSDLYVKHNKFIDDTLDALLERL